jgi:hypothetical protein
MRKSLVVLVLLAGCVQVSKTVLMDRSNKPVPKESVYVFLANDSIPTSCERVAILHASGDEELTNEGEMIDELRSEAGKLGANALHLLTMEEAGTRERVAAAVFGTEADRNSQALALWCPERLEGGS